MNAPDLAAMNAGMTQRLLSTPPQPYVDGSHALRVVHTVGRRSGQRRSTPLGVLQLDGRRYLVSPVRARDWCRNLDADPAVVIDPGDEHHRAVPVAGDEAARAVAAYLAATTTPWALTAFPVAPDADVAEIVAHLDAMAVYRLDPA